jgi:hypothetical protein
MNSFIDNTPLLVFTSMVIGLYAGKYIGIIDGIQREQKAQARRNRIQREIQEQRFYRREKNNSQVK